MSDADEAEAPESLVQRLAVRLLRNRIRARESAGAPSLLQHPRGRMRRANARSECSCAGGGGGIAVRHASLGTWRRLR
jgi:hypothetical protein